MFKVWCVRFYSKSNHGAISEACAPVKFLVWERLSVSVRPSTHQSVAIRQLGKWAQFLHVFWCPISPISQCFCLATVPFRSPIHTLLSWNWKCITPWHIQLFALWNATTPVYRDFFPHQSHLLRLCEFFPVFVFFSCFTFQSFGS